jgi:uncharacterized protein YceK
MRNFLFIISVSALALSGCSRDPAAGIAAQKMYGPEVHSLHHDQLMVIFHECHQFGPVDDPRVKYAVPYCVGVDTAQSAEGWTTPNAAKVDPKLTKLH